MAESLAAQVELLKFGAYVYVKNQLLRVQIEAGRFDVALANEVLALFADFTDRLERRGGAGDLKLVSANRRYMASLYGLLEAAGSCRGPTDG